MKQTAMLSVRAQLLIGALVALLISYPARAQDNPAPSKVVPMIQVNDAPLYQMIDLLARQAEINYIIDARTPPGPGPIVNFCWSNITARAALDRLLKEHDFELVEDPITTVAQIGPRNLHVQSANPALVGDDTNAPVPVVQVTDAPLDQAIKLLANQARLKIVFDERLFDAPDGRPYQMPSVSFRWQRLTPRQALAALLECYQCTMVEIPSTHEFRIRTKPRSDTATAIPLEQSNSGSPGTSSARRAVPISVITGQLLIDAPIFLVSVAALVVCLLRWQQVPRSAALFCLAGFASIASSTLFGTIAWVMIYNLMSGDRQRTGAAMRELGLARVLVTSIGLVLLLIAVFTEREQRPVSPPSVPT